MEHINIQITVHVGKKRLLCALTEWVKAGRLTMDSVNFDKDTKRARGKKEAVVQYSLI